MSAIKQGFINPLKCDGKEECPAQKACPAGAITREDNDEPYFVSSRCVGCRQCLQVCPNKAISMI